MAVGPAGVQPLSLKDLTPARWGSGACFAAVPQALAGQARGHAGQHALDIDDASIVSFAFGLARLTRVRLLLGENGTEGCDDTATFYDCLGTVSSSSDKNQAQKFLLCERACLGSIATAVRLAG